MYRKMLEIDSIIIAYFDRYVIHENEKITRDWAATFKQGDVEKAKSLPAMNLFDLNIQIEEKRKAWLQDFPMGLAMSKLVELGEYLFIDDIYDYWISTFEGTIPAMIYFSSSFDYRDTLKIDILTEQE